MPTCDDDDLLDDLSSHYKLPLVCIIPSSQLQKSGLLVCSRKGEFRYWEDITQDSIFEDHYSSLKVYLQDGDFGTHLACHEVQKNIYMYIYIFFFFLKNIIYNLTLILQYYFD
jgi:hypothetical protein